MLQDEIAFFRLAQDGIGVGPKKPLSSVLSFRKGFYTFCSGETLSGLVFQLQITHVMFTTVNNLTSFHQGLLFSLALLF